MSWNKKKINPTFFLFLVQSDSFDCIVWPTVWNPTIFCLQKYKKNYVGISTWKLND